MVIARPLRWPSLRDLGVEELRSASPADDDDLVAVESRGGVEGHVGLVGRLDPARPLQLGEGEVLRRGVGGVQHPLHAVDPRTPVHPEGVGEQVDQPVERVLRRHRQLLDRLQVEGEVGPGGVAADPHDLHPVEAVAGRDDRVGHRARLGLEQHVVDRGAVGTLLHDLDRVDVTPGLADRRREAAQRTGDVGQLDTQEKGHGVTLTRLDVGPVSGAQGADRAARSAWRRCRSPVARLACAAIAARTADSEPTTRTWCCARVTAV